MHKWIEQHNIAQKYKHYNVCQIYAFRSFHRQLDPSHKGRIPQESFLNAMTQRGIKLPPEVVLKMLNNKKYQCQPFTSDTTGGNGAAKNANHQQQHQPMFNYEAYCNDVIATSEALLSKVKQITAENEQNYSINSNTYKVSNYVLQIAMEKVN